MVVNLQMNRKKRRLQHLYVSSELNFKFQSSQSSFDAVFLWDLSAMSFSLKILQKDFKKVFSNKLKMYDSQHNWTSYDFGYFGDPWWLQALSHLRQKRCKFILVFLEKNKCFTTHQFSNEMHKTNIRTHLVWSIFSLGRS